LKANTPTQKPVLKVVASINTGYTNEDNTGLYWRIIEEVFKDHYHIEKVTTKWEKAIELVSNNEADILLGIINKEDNRFIYSSSHINKTYPIHAFYHKDRFTINGFTELDNLSVVLRQGSSIERLLRNKDNIYQVNSIYQADKLVLNQRVDIALAYSYNTHLVSPNNLLSNQEIIGEKNVLLAFKNNNKGLALQSKFDHAMQNAINENRLIKVFPSHLEYQHASYQRNIELDIIQWNLAPKLYNKKTKRLEVLKREVQYSQYLIKELPKFRFNINTKSLKQSLPIDNKMLNACSFSFKASQNKSLYYSEPAHVYIKPKLFILNDNIPKFLTKPLKNKSSIKLNELMLQNPSLQVAISKDGVIYNNIGLYVDKPLIRKFYVVDVLENKKMMSLLLAKRIHAFIAWPGTVGELLDNKEDIHNIRSISLEEDIGRSVFSYISCSHSPEGKEVIHHINEILSDPKHHKGLFKQTLQQLDKDSQDEYIKLMNLNL
jgi:ABC-type amino acid transport substrate-binding protein